MLTSAKLILKAWRMGEKENSPEGFKLFIIYGEGGIGKSAYAFKTGVQVLQELYQVDKKTAWKAVRSYLVFHPEQFFEKLDQCRELDIKLPFLIWDDAGLWLFAMDYHDPFVKQFQKELNVIRSKTASILFTTPSSEFLLKKIRKYPNTINVNIILNTDKTNPWRRLAKGYVNKLLPSGKQIVNVFYEDDFSCRMPKPFFKWYKPIRDEYEHLARKMLEEKWEKLKAESPILQKYAPTKKLKVPPPLGVK